jgi:hypothetical protein
MFFQLSKKNLNEKCEHIPSAHSLYAYDVMMHSLWQKGIFFSLSPPLLRVAHRTHTANNFPFIAQSNALLASAAATTTDCIERERERVSERINGYDLHLALVRQSLGRAVDCLSACYSFAVRDTHDFFLYVFFCEATITLTLWIDLCVRENI